MKNIVIIGDSKGIGNVIVLQQLENNYIHNISNNTLDISGQIIEMDYGIVTFKI